MTIRDFWSNAVVAVIGGGSWGTVLAQLMAPQCREVRLWMRSEASVRAINSTRFHLAYFPHLELDSKIVAVQEFERLFELPPQLIWWVLPSAVCREYAKKLSPFLKGSELIIHATKGMEEKTGYRISQILLDELPCRRIGVLSGPNLAHEIAKGEPAATIVASPFPEVCEAGKFLLNSPSFQVQTLSDRTGVEWAGILKNPLAIAMGAVEALNLGWNTRALIMTRGLSEMSQLAVRLGAQAGTFFTLAGIGDLWATCSSSQSRNYRAGFRLASGDSLESVIAESSGVIEGIQALPMICELSEKQGLPCHTFQGIRRFVFEGKSMRELLHEWNTEA